MSYDMPQIGPKQISSSYIIYGSVIVISFRSLTRQSGKNLLQIAGIHKYAFQT